VKDKRGQLLLYLMNILCKLYILRTLTVTLVGKSLEVEEVELYNLHSSHYYYGCEKGVHRHLPPPIITMAVRKVFIDTFRSLVFIFLLNHRL